ncbi:O-antigen ligase family protein [Butyrivibrio sp. AE2032]|uniref:O-antigen ligase family protein n=1 Tax=Butyrivibrio sp. AE2032 TaxID=1458463 RepID=UPI0005519055|nr:O-antigen ligase family protein [Butyrivibrio sp. AE2032]
MNSNKRIIKQEPALRLLKLSIILSPLRCYGMILGGFNFSLFRIAGLFMIISWLAFNRRIKIYSITKYIGIILLISVLQISYSPYISGGYSSCLSQIYGFIWMLFASQIIMKTKDYDGVIKSIILSSIFPLFLGLYQWVIYKSTGSIPGLPFGFLVSAEGKLGLKYNIYARITSCFGDPAYMTTFFVGVFSIALQRVITEPLITFKDKVYKVIYISIIILVILETVMSISVSGIVGLAVSTVLFFLFYVKEFKKFAKIFSVVLLLSLGFVIYFMNSGSELIYILKFKMSTSSETMTNMYGRSEHVMNALNVWLDNPFFGGGFGSLRLNGGFSSAHSSLLTVLGQQGIFVFVLNIIILIIYPISIFRVLKKQNEKMFYSLFLGPFVGLMSILALTLGYDTLYSLDSCYVLIAVVNSFSNSYLESKEQ